MQHVVARFHCDKRATVQSQWMGTNSNVEIEMTPVNGNSPEDQPFQASSPGGDLKLTLSYQASDFVKNFFKPGKKYNLTFEEVDTDNGI